MDLVFALAVELPAFLELQRAPPVGELVVRVFSGGLAIRKLFPPFLSGSLSQTPLLCGLWDQVDQALGPPARVEGQDWESCSAFLELLELLLPAHQETV